MSQISDLILKQVQSAAAGSNLDNNVLSGLSDSVFGSMKQTAQSASGIEQLTSLFTGKTSAASSPVTSLATQLFTKNVASKLGLDSSTSSMATNLLPVIISSLVSAVSSKSGGIDLGTILSALGGKSSSSGLLKTVGSLLSGFLKKK